MLSESNHEINFMVFDHSQVSKYGISKNQKSLFVKLDSWKVSQMVKNNCLSHGNSRNWNIWLVEKTYFMWNWRILSNHSVEISWFGSQIHLVKSILEFPKSPFFAFKPSKSAEIHKKSKFRVFNVLEWHN